MLRRYDLPYLYSDRLDSPYGLTTLQFRSQLVYPLETIEGPYRNDALTNLDFMGKGGWLSLVRAVGYKYHPKLARSGYKEQLDTHIEEQPVGPIQGVKLV